MASIADTTRGAARVAPSTGVRQVSRLFDLMVAAAVLIVLIAAYHIHMELTAGDWDQVALGEVVSRALMPFERCGPGRVVIGGPSAALAARKSLMLTLCLNELATNAAKYGALSNCSGKVYVSWELTGEGGDRKVKLSWRETSGPTVSVPERKGFGSLLIEQSLGGQGESRLEFSPEGLRCCLHLLLE